MSDTTNLNPVIQDNPADTINHCADVISYMAFFNDNDAGEPNDDIVHGGHLIFDTVIQALKYEAERVQS